MINVSNDVDIIIKYLYSIGWNDVNDVRFKNRIIGDIYDKFPDVSINTLLDVVNSVIK